MDDFAGILFLLRDLNGFFLFTYFSFPFRNGNVDKMIFWICCTLFSFVLISCLIWKSLIWLYATIGAVTAAVVRAVFLMFNAPIYAEFLRIVGYGGGIPVKISERIESEKKTFIEGYLLLRTTDSFLLYNKNTNLISEYSPSVATEVAHAAGGLRRLPYALPDAR
ncbi:hypothetical protein [Cupriavidus sp. CuC1]|uniref:hypothetical protein n=1 Tax=Cupriavidus sp. CuC1 TaxID=3373131 RepID=UPI0037D78892